MTHVPVLLKEIIEILNPQPGEFFVDGTLGNGGHAIEIIKRIWPNGIFLGIDWDKEVIERLKIERLKDFKNVILVHDNYTNLPKILKDKNLGKADGLILDLGFSSQQLEESGRGFSFLKNEPLDMRYNQNQGEPASVVVNYYGEKDLTDIFWKYGEEKFSRRIAKKIVEERKKKRILTTFDLVDAIKKAAPFNHGHSKIHPATRVFQALRIYINDELGNLEKLLKNIHKIIRMGAFGLPKPQAEARHSDAKGRIRLRQGFGGRVAIISFHSLEDRLVKSYFRKMANEGGAEILTKKPIGPSEEERKNNPRSRSAKMRAIRML